MYVYIGTGLGVWTVGFYAPDGCWFAESDHSGTEQAAKRVHYLNGGEKDTLAALDTATAILRDVREHLKDEKIGNIHYTIIMALQTRIDKFLA